MSNLTDEENKMMAKMTHRLYKQYRFYVYATFLESSKIMIDKLEPLSYPEMSPRETHALITGFTLGFSVLVESLGISPAELRDMLDLTKSS